MRYAVLLLLCLGCANAPTAYNQAALPIRPPPPPRAPVFNPAEDAPHTFEPGRPSPVQPGPRPTRVLPQDERTRREPGIWAGDGPRAVGGPSKLEIAGVPLPVPEPEWSVNQLEGYAPHLCHGLITHNAFSPAYVLRGDALTQAQKECLIATWYQHCLSWAAEAVVAPKTKGLATIASHFWKRYVDPAIRFKDEKCGPKVGDSLKPHADFATHYWDDVYKSYRRSNP